MAQDFSNLKNDPRQSSRTPSEAGPLRTFQDDMAQALQAGKSTLTKVALDEQKRRIARNEESPEDIALREEKRSHRMRALASMTGILFVLGGLAAIAFVIYVKTQREVPAPMFRPGGIFASEILTEISLDGLGKDQLIQAILNSRQQSKILPGEIEDVYFTTGSGDDKTRASAQDFLERFESGMPSILIRSLSGDFMYGIYGQRREGFLVLRTESFQNALGGMLAYESIMDQSLSLLLSPTDISPVAKNAGFNDEILNNSDARVLRSVDGGVKMLYSFVDSKTLVIAASTEAFKQIINRLHADKLSR